MYYVGVDLHKKQSWFYVMDAAGKKIDSISISNERDTLKKYISGLPTPFTLAVETTYNWYFFVDLAREYTDNVYLANSYELKAFAKRHKKTDKIDARLIADVLRKGYLPTVFIPNTENRRLKEHLNYRMNLVQNRTRLIIRLKALLDRYGFIATGDFTTDKRLDELLTENIPDGCRCIVEKYVTQLKWYRRQIFDYKKELIAMISGDDDIKNLITIPGISYFSAALIKSQIADISRFATFNRLCAYAGLAPRVHQSGDTCRHGPLNKNRRKLLQWILLEVSIIYWHALPERARYFEAIKRRKGTNTAKVAAAREMLKMVYHVLKEKRPFFYKTERSQRLRSKGSEALLMASAS